MQTQLTNQIAPLTARDGSPSSKVHAKGHLHVTDTVKKLGECLHLLKRYTTLRGMRICNTLFDQSYPSLIHKPHVGGMGKRLRDIPITCPNYVSLEFQCNVKTQVEIICPKL